MTFAKSDKEAFTMLVDIRSEVENIVKDYVSYDSKADFAATPLKNLGFDSLDVMDMIFSIEKKFDVRTNFEDVDLQRITVSNIVEAVQNQKSIS